MCGCQREWGVEMKRFPLRFTRMRLENWRNFRSVDVVLPRRVFLVGPNASGKSNLLDVFRFLFDLVSEIGGGLQAAVGRRSGVSSIRCLAARRNPDVTVHVWIGTDEHPNIWEYELSLGSTPQQRAVVRRERLAYEEQDRFQRPDENDRIDPVLLSQTFLQQVNINRQFRELVGFFASIRYLHIVPQLVREPERSVGRKNDPYGGDFLEQIARTPEKVRVARLKRIRQALQVAVPQLQELDLWRDERGTPHLKAKYEHWRPQGAWQSEGQFSDGTLRLMGLLWALLDGNGPLLLEEPELSLNAGIVRHIPQMFARLQGQTGRQIVVSTHSPDLLNDSGVGLNEVLLLIPGKEGTQVKPATDFKEIVSLVEGGLPLGEAVLPRTQPSGVQQLTLFGEIS